MTDFGAMPGPRRVGKYEILDEIARGGMGVVYRGRQPSLGRPVAIKMLLPGFADDAEFESRFQNEAGAIALLAHEHIVRIHDVLHEAGAWYIIMELVAGPSLRRVMDGAGALEIARAADLARQMAAALALAHGRDIVHRDIKPANLLFSAAGVLKVMDFGIAKMATSRLRTMTGTVLGTPAYMSPEQAAGEAVDRRSDLYAVSTVLFEMLTGRLPFTGVGAVLVAMQHLSAPPPDPRTLRPDLPEGLARVVLRGLAKRRADRFQSAEELSAALAPYADAGRRGVAPPSPVVGCPSCGQPARADFTACPSCGASLETTCAGCGQSHPARFGRCPFCWRRSVEGATPPPAPARAADLDTAPTTPSGRRCRGCGEALRPDFLRCPFCGLEVATPREHS